MSTACLLRFVPAQVRGSAGLRDLSWLLSGSVLTLPIGVLSTVLLVRCYSQEDIGGFFLVQSWLSALAGFGLPGISVILISCVSRGEGGSFHRGVLWQLIAGTLGGICLAAIGLCFADSVPVPPWAYLAAACAYPFFLLDAGWHALMGRRLYRLSSALQVTRKAGHLLILLLAIFLHWSIAWYFVVDGFWIVTLNLLLIVANWRHAGDPKKSDSATLRYGLNLTLSNVLLQPLGQAERLLVGLWFGAADLAVFGLGEMVYGCLKIPAGHIQSVYFPRVSVMRDDDVREYLWRNAVRWTTAWIAFSVAVLLLMPLIYPLLFGAAYAKSAILAGCYAMAFAFGVPNFFLTILFRRFRATRETYIYGLVRAPLQLCFIALGCVLLGIHGLPLARWLTVVSHAIIGLWLARRAFPVTPALSAPALGTEVCD
jgi:O-antigen/teichoic acid export membrane protein